jgi:hypothetical protein
MKKIFKKSLLAKRILFSVLTITFVIFSYQEASAKFWGKEYEDLPGDCWTTPDGSQCFKSVLVKEYVFWVCVDEHVEDREVPC